MPQAAQLNSSVWRSMQLPSHSTRPSPHSDPAPASPPVVLMLLPPQATATTSASMVKRWTHIPEDPGI
jgi:hypothetical protein